MKKNNVKYTELLFNKPYGIMYIDDKSVRPDEFLNMEVELLYGRSNAIVERVGNVIKKYDFKDKEKIKSQFDWYKQCPEYINIPSNIDYKNGIISMGYINGVSLNDVISIDILDGLLQVVEQYSHIKKNYNFSTYIDRVEDHIIYNNNFTICIWD